jgi:hypothetical protein
MDFHIFLPCSLGVKRVWKVLLSVTTFHNVDVDDF